MKIFFYAIHNHMSSNKDYAFWVRIFEIPETQRVGDKFTVYKITSTIFPRSHPEASTSVVVYRRYSEIRKLYKAMVDLHAKLNLPGYLPSFPHPSLINRFDPDVIEGRRSAALNLLRHCARHQQLFTSDAFTKFFHVEKETSSKVISIANAGVLNKEKSRSTLTDKKNTADRSSTEHISTFLKIRDPFSLSSAHIGILPTLVPRLENSENSQVTSSNVAIKEEEASSKTTALPKQEKLCSLTSQSSTGPQPYSIFQNPIHESPKHKKSASHSDKTSLKDGLDSSLLSTSHSEHLIATNLEDWQEVDNLPQSLSADSVFDSHSSNDEQSSYIKEAAKQITLAQSFETKNDFQNALDLYTEGVGTLLTGIKVDTDKARRSAVKVRTAQYLQRAEKLVARLTRRDSKSQLGSTWQSVAPEDSMACPPSYLKNYKVFGISGKVLLAVDKSTKDTVAIKVLTKNNHKDSEGKVILPTEVPHMVPLVRFHETEYAIILILKYICGGKLSHHITSYISQSLSQEREEPFSSSIDSLYVGRRLICEESPDIQVSKDSLAQVKFINTSHSTGKLNSLCPSSNSLTLSVEHLNACETSVADDSQVNATEPVFGNDMNDSTDSLSMISEDFDNPCLSSIDHSCAEIVQDELQGLQSAKSQIVSASARDLSSKHFNKDESCSLNGLDLCSTRESSFHSQSYCAKTALSESCVAIAQCGNSKGSAKEFSFDELIKNSKKLLNDVTQTLEKSKSQVLSVSPDVSIPSVPQSCDNFFPSSIFEHSPDEAGCSKPVSCPSLIDDSTVSQKDNPSRMNFTKHSKEITNGPSDNNSSLGMTLNLNDCSPRKSPLSLSKLLERYSSQANLERLQLPENLVKVWASQIISAVESLHKLGIIWGDLNMSNILLDDGGCILVTFESRWPCISAKRKVPHPQNCAYIAPELMSPLCLPRFSCDFWSIGALLYHLLTGTSVSEAHPTGVLSHTEILFSSNLSREAQSLISELLRFDPSERLGGGSLGIQEIKDHPFFVGIQWES